MARKKSVNDIRNQASRMIRELNERIEKAGGYKTAEGKRLQIRRNRMMAKAASYMDNIKTKNENRKVSQRTYMGLSAG